MFCIYSTLDVSNFDKSNDNNDKQLLNILDIYKTDEVFILPNLIYSKFSQFSNILIIEVTIDVSKFDKSISVILDEN